MSYVILLYTTGKVTTTKGKTHILYSTYIQTTAKTTLEPFKMQIGEKLFYICMGFLSVELNLPSILVMAIE